MTLLTGMPASRRTTVLLPLHRAAPWRDSILRSVENLVPVARVVVSDATGDDDTLDWLADSLALHPGRAAVELVSPRPLTAGWVAHANDLQRNVITEYCMWLSQDDDVDSEWVQAGERALDANPEAVLAVGTLQLDAGGVTENLPPIDEYAAPVAVERVRSALRRQFFRGPPGLGHAFRGVQRVSRSIPLPVTTVDGVPVSVGWKADVLWALRLLSRGPFLPIDAVYRKTVHPESASHHWASENEMRGFRRLVVEHLDGLSDHERLAVVTEIWDEESTRFRRRVRSLERSRRDRVPTD